MTQADYAKLHHFALSAAYLCIDCQSVHNSNSWCPACSSSIVVPLTRWVAELVTRVKELEPVK